jgi:hypothetical protein
VLASIIYYFKLNRLLEDLLNKNFLIKDLSQNIDISFKMLLVVAGASFFYMQSRFDEGSKTYIFIFYILTIGG